MGTIDLDPASSAVANLRVLAVDIFTQAENGLEKMWWGNVWLNHPFGRDTNAAWVEKISNEWSDSNIKAACCITFACTSERWFQPLTRRPQCYLSPRTNYFLPDGTLKRGVTKGRVVTYFGEDLGSFFNAFRGLGSIKIAL